MADADDQRTAEIKKAWDYHKEADGLLHSRVESFFVAQAFLIAAFVYLVVEGQQNRALLAPLGAAIVVLGIAITCAILWLNRLLIKRISFLKRAYLRDDPVYADYMRGRSRRSDKDSDNDMTEGLTRFVLPIVIPLSFLAFWAFCAWWGAALLGVRWDGASIAWP